MMKTVFIINNKNNRLKKVLSRLENACNQGEVGSVEFLTTQRKKHAVELARQASENQCDYLIAIGGDGTLHEVVNGVFQSNSPKSAYPVLGLLPYGSANDFAKTAGISESIEALLACIQSKSEQRLDLGKIVLNEVGKTHYFINIAGIGIGPEVVHSLERASGLFGPRLTYFTHIIKAFLGYHKKKVVCRSGQWQWSGPLLQMAVSNGKYFGNGICIAPDAKLTDGQFQLAIFGDLRLWDYLKNLRKLKKGHKIDHPEVTYHRAKEMTLESDMACGIEADGEYVGLAPATFSILPGAIRFLLPPDPA
jgi:YegS/Rv2252/BmrU family lipid kinase